MTMTTRGRVLAAAILVAVAAPLFGQQPTSPSSFGPPPPAPFSWWKSEPFKKELGMTAEQSARIEKIWESTRAELRLEWEEFSKLETKLSKMIQNDSDEAVLSRQIDRVETARANANKTRTLMLVQMRRVLLPDQRTKLDGMYARWQDQQKKLQPPAPSSHEPQRPGEG